MPHSVIGGILYSLAPTVLVGLIFWFVIRSIFRADKSERSAYSEIEAEERARAEAQEAAESSPS